MQAIWKRYGIDMSNSSLTMYRLILKTIIDQNIEKILTKNSVILNILAKKKMERSTKT